MTKLITENTYVKVILAFRDTELAVVKKVKELDVDEMTEQGILDAVDLQLEDFINEVTYSGVHIDVEKNEVIFFCGLNCVADEEELEMSCPIDEFIDYDEYTTEQELIEALLDEVESPVIEWVYSKIETEVSIIN